AGIRGRHGRGGRRVSAGPGGRGSRFVGLAWRSATVSGTRAVRYPQIAPRAPHHRDAVARRHGSRLEDELFPRFALFDAFEDALDLLLGALWTGDCDDEEDGTTLPR